MTELSTDGIIVGTPPRAKWRRVIVLTSLGLVLVAVLAALFMVRTVDSQLADIGRTYEIRREARELMLSIVDAETGQRGYLLTGDPVYLDPYNRAVANLSDRNQRLMRLIEGNDAQRQRLEGLLPDLDAKRAEMARTIELMSSGRNAEALALLRTDTGQELMERLRETLRSFIEEEDARLVERNERMEVYRQALVIAILAALAAAAVLGYSLLARTQRRVAALSQEQSILRSQNVELEEKIRERTAEAEEARAHAERERARLETLLQDTNHRIGNSLATVSSLLGLQLARTSSDEVRRALEAAQSRVQAIASGHRRLRLGADLETTNAAEFLHEVIDDLAASVPPDKKVAFSKKIEPLIIPARDATTIGIVVSELVTNALKHAFADDGRGSIWVVFGVNEAGIPRLQVDDDGRGLSPTDGPQTGLGALIINQLARQFGGDEPAYLPRDGGGTSVIVELPKLRTEPD
ncbi:CHASE3 domain-containing protein [Devosia sp. ZB163]|uniref:sensor histidine kinase n=1 Tax=Devosia sp. ZB163 TaxID=3025938 RepID=UPI00235E741D|nr:CHASE3 domain-containing protein [Devosia sp. ZB163]MDC9825420.1 CHASE3 domain-containing protein [Devosia sp. ZB163]